MAGSGQGLWPWQSAQRKRGPVEPGSINFLAVLSAAAGTFLIGGAWYSPMLFGRSWQKLVGLSDEELASSLPRVFAGSFGLALVMALNLAAFLGPEATVAFGVGAGIAAGLGWVAAGMGVTYLFERRPFRLFLINAGYHVVSFTMMGALLGLWH